ncbi:MAG: DegT/DnrJ/EryC1/StrS family aminotransferase [Promethearchaeota archaeon]
MDFTKNNEGKNIPLMPNFPPIKFDLQTRFGSIYDEEEKKAILEVLKRDAPTSNISVLEFEKKFAEYCNSKYAISVSNGTAALFICFKSIGIKPGDEVITTPITWIATAAAAEVLGAKIKFADIDPNTFNIDPSLVGKLITEKTKAICPVHLYGQPVDMDPILGIAEKNNIYVIEDAAHAPGGRYKSKKTGNIGDMGCFSFHEQKNMSTLGEGGMITTNNHELYEKARSYKSHCARVIGPSSKYLSFPEEKAMEYLNKKMFWYQDFDDTGYNFRMNDMTASVGIAQLSKLDKMNNIRNKIATIYDQKLEKIQGLKPLGVIDKVFHTYHLYPVLLDPKITKISREKFIYKLRMKGIKAGVHYMPLVLTTAFKKRGYSEKDALKSVKYWQNLITLPIHPCLNEIAIDYLFRMIEEIL